MVGIIGLAGSCQRRHLTAAGVYSQRIFVNPAEQLVVAIRNSRREPQDCEAEAQTISLIRAAVSASQPDSGLWPQRAARSDKSASGQLSRRSVIVKSRVLELRYWDDGTWCGAPCSLGCTAESGHLMSDLLARHLRRKALVDWQNRGDGMHGGQGLGTDPECFTDCSRRSAVGWDIAGTSARRRRSVVPSRRSGFAKFSARSDLRQIAWQVPPTPPSSTPPYHGMPRHR